MGKYSDFKRIPKDLYMTRDPLAAARLIPFLKAEGIMSFVEPCYGWGHLVGPLTAAGLECRGRYDIELRGRAVKDHLAPAAFGTLQRRDGWQLSFFDLHNADAIITNPPWTRAVLHRLIARWAFMVPTWLLFDAGWKHTRQARLLMPLCTDIMALPRLRWFPGTTSKAADDCCWYRFHAAEAERMDCARFWPLGSSPKSDGSRRAL
ncbi:conserved hypothetical protein [Roseibium sp. TrichSKD4]|uniref:hypothetical protein n=1 Tax=Roseibium sp. TrichSKD4 TaxID=744980 RepID=UPI0001E56D9C|nr:hypothetical protein [Roseibium sp. TrichSKD4]EFO31534.1 conserved hypothetical protein [Roseibium sp. TrichSKD4]